MKVSEEDHLEQDAPIRGQRYACMSFVSPEEVLARKEAFVMRRFLSALAADVEGMLSGMDAAYGALPSSTDPDAPRVGESVRLLRERYAYMWDDGAMQEEYRAFAAKGSSELDSEFREAHGEFGTTIRGFKIRGSYDTLEQAQKRAETIRKADDRFHVYVAEVGCWCPWSPNVEDLEDAEYAETQLNTLMKKYKESADSKNALYSDRKDRLVRSMNEERELWLARAREKKDD